jgi:hypothetical protein
MMLGFDAQGRLPLGGAPATNIIAILVAAVGSYAATGSTTIVKAVLKLSAALASYGITGKLLKAGTALTLGVASYTLVGVEMLQDYFSPPIPFIRNLMGKLGKVRQLPPVLDQ